MALYLPHKVFPNYKGKNNNFIGKLGNCHFNT